MKALTGVSELIVITEKKQAENEEPEETTKLTSNKDNQNNEIDDSKVQPQYTSLVSIAGYGSRPLRAHGANGCCAVVVLTIIIQYTA